MRHVVANSPEARKAGQAAGVVPVESIGDRAADGRRMVALRIAQATAQLKLSAIGGGDFECAGHVRLFAFARHMGDDDCFSVIQQFEFEQIVTSPRAIGRIGAAQHQTLRSPMAELAQLLHQCLVTGCGPLRCHFDMLCGGRLQRGPRSRQAILKRATGLGCIEHHVAHLPPSLIVVSATRNDRLCGVEVSAPGPEFTVQGQCRPILREPWRCLYGQALAAVEFVPGLVSVHTIIFFADRVGGERHALAIAIGQCGLDG